MTKTKNKKIWIGVIVALVLCAAVVCAVLYARADMVASELTTDEAQTLIENALDAMPGTNARASAKYIAEVSHVTVNSLSYGVSKDVRADCTVTTIDAGAVLLAHVDELLNMNTIDPLTGMEMTSTKIKLKLDGALKALLETATPVTREVEIALYETTDGFVVYTSDAVVDACYGGVVTASKKIEAMTAITVDGESVAISTNLKRGLTECVKLTYNARQPDVSVPIIKTFNNLKYDFYRNFIQNDNWHYITKGLWVTLRVTFFSVIIGIALGFLVAIVRVTNEKTGKLKLANAICKLYLTVLRGTPVLVQLMIVYFVIFMPIGIDKFIAAVICFGLNSGAYVAEIVRGGIQSIDAGQMEAGRSLGFGYAQTMLYIIMPQTFKAVLPALLNEFIGLLKETSVSAYIGLNDLARGGDIIRGVTYSAFMPLIAVAAVYLAVVVFLQWLVGKLERRLRTNER